MISTILFSFLNDSVSKATCSDSLSNDPKPSSRKKKFCFAYFASLHSLRGPVRRIVIACNSNNHSFSVIGKPFCGSVKSSTASVDVYRHQTGLQQSIRHPPVERLQSGYIFHHLLLLFQAGEFLKAFA